MLKFCKFVKSTPSFLAHAREEPAIKFQKTTEKVERRRAPPVAVSVSHINYSRNWHNLI